MPERARARTSAAAASGRGRRRQPGPALRLEAGGRVGLVAPAEVANAHDLPFPQNHDLKEARDQAARAESLEPPPVQLHEDAVAELDHLPGAQPVRVGAPEQGADDL